MTILVTGDFHFSDSQRDFYRHEFQKWLRDTVRKHHVDLVIVLGDLTEAKDEHGAWLVNRVVDHVHRLLRECDVLIIRGNHDYVDPSTPFYAFLRRLPGVAWVNMPTDAKDLPIAAFKGMGRTLLLPHTSDHDKDWKGLRIHDCQWVFTHNTFQDVYIGHGQHLSGIPLGTVSGGPRVFSGDIHIPQQLGPVCYVGAPYLIDFGDDYSPRVILINDKKEAISLPCPGPQKRLLEVADLKVDLAKAKGINPGDILKVRIKIDLADHAKWPQLKQKVKDWGAECGYVIHTVQPVRTEQRRALGAKRLERARKSDVALLEAYATQRGVPDKTIKTGRILLRQV